MKKKTHEEYVNELKLLNPNIEVVETYRGANIKILHQCKIDGYRWDATPHNILKGGGCPKCSNHIKRTQDMYIKDVLSVNPNIEVLGNYINNITPILHKCKTHNIEWIVSPNSILRGHGCRQCGNDLLREQKVKSHKQYVKELQEVNPNIIVIDTYINSNTPIKHKCLIDDYEWKAQPNNILVGKGCPKCGGVLKKTHDSYIKEVSSVNSNIEVLEKYINAKTPILHRCKIHNIEWKICPNNILSGHGCTECCKEKIGIKNGKSHEQYVEELKEVNSNIVVVGLYEGSNNSILHKCLVDGFEWEAKPNNILHGTGCPKCANNIKKTHDKYVQEIGFVNPYIEVIGQYINANTPILHKCKIHNIKWDISPTGVLSGKGCVKCGKEKTGNKLRKTHDKYIEEVKQVNSDIYVVGIYIDANTPILHRCLLDGYEWYAKPNNILNSFCGCPQCNESSGERQIRQWLEKYNIEYCYQKSFKDCRDTLPLPFDFYLPKYNFCIEYDHKQHFEPIEHFGGQEKFNLTVKHDNMKNEYCKNNGISLLRIPYFKNIEEELNNFLFI